MSIHYPDPPRTKGMHPEQWPTSDQLTNEHLLQLLSKYRGQDDLMRTGRWNPRIRRPGDEEKVRFGLNKILADLHQEAVTRGLVDPYNAPTSYAD